MLECYVLCLDTYLEKHLMRCISSFTFGYGDVIYHIPSNNYNPTSTLVLNFYMEKLESVQYSAARAITDAWKGTSKEKLSVELG